MSGLSGFSSILKSAGSFAPSMISGSTAGKNDPQLDKKKVMIRKHEFRYFIISILQCSFRRGNDRAVSIMHEIF